MTTRDEVSVFVSPSGDVSFIHDDDVAEMFTDEQTETTRASHVEPAAGGGWTADMSPVGGPVLLAEGGVPFTRRADALAAELKYLDERMAEGGFKR